MSAPLRFARLTSLALAFAFGIIGMSVGINALVKSRRQQHSLERNAPLGASVSIDDSDVFDSGVVDTVVCGLIALTSIFSLATLARPFATKLSGHILLFLSVWLFATLVAFTDFVANRQAKISATLGGQPLPASVIQAFEQELGESPVYHKLDYLRLAAILPWFAFLFALSSAVLSYLSARSTVAAGTTAGAGTAEKTGDGNYAVGAQA